MNQPNQCAALAIALRLQSNPLVGRVAELIYAERMVMHHAPAQADRIRDIRQLTGGQSQLCLQLTGRLFPVF